MKFRFHDIFIIVMQQQLNTKQEQEQVQLTLFTWRFIIGHNPTQFSAVAKNKEQARKIIIKRLHEYHQNEKKNIATNTLFLEGCYVPPAWHALYSDTDPSETSEFVVELYAQDPEVHPITEGFVILSSCLDG
jgi:hypothetical protein